eukprot:TRINITY_DN30764_c0_g1_i1.p1 TRINITY_DN30764_c0_g1~~TRINITY_DN30764_c0_g1_i1.p1  ORF type:complete len:660 (+),score=115.03 TRINITY_DN30764_c0_g1_i1:42-2021(+)
MSGAVPVHTNEIEELRRRLKEKEDEIAKLKGGKLGSDDGKVQSTPTPTAPEKSMTSSFVPTFLRQIASPDVKTVALIGCGGGFDFVQSMILYPELKRMGKEILIISNSFTDVNGFHVDTAPIVWESGGAQVRHVTSSSVHPNPKYMPEVHLCTYLDQQYPGCAPHGVYACNARRWSVPSMSNFLSWVQNKHRCQGFLTIDGGTDSLMRGDEECLGHPIEDLVTIAAVASLGDQKGHKRVHIKGIDAALSDDEVLEFAKQSGDLRDARLADPRHGKRGSRKMRYGTLEFCTHEGAADMVNRTGTQLGRFVVSCEWDRGESPIRLLLNMNFGADRVAGVTDATSFRAIAELTRMGGYRGCISLEPNTPQMNFYAQLLDYMDERPPGPGYFKPHVAQNAPMRSSREALHHAEAMCTFRCSIEGQYGPLGIRGDFVWPLMSIVWAFDPASVINRSYIAKWIHNVSLPNLQMALQMGRQQLRDAGLLLPVEVGRDGTKVSNNVVGSTAAAAGGNQTTGGSNGSVATPTEIASPLAGQVSPSNGDNSGGSTPTNSSGMSGAAQPPPLPPHVTAATASVASYTPQLPFQITLPSTQQQGISSKQLAAAANFAPAHPIPAPFNSRTYVPAQFTQPSAQIAEGTPLVMPTLAAATGTPLPGPGMFRTQ